MSTIEKALLEATGVKPRKSGETRQKYLGRIHAGVVKISDEGWSSLEATAGAQEWANAAIEADNEKAPFPEFSDAEDAGDEEEVIEEKKASPKKSTKPAAAKKVDEDKPAAAKKGPSMRRALKMIIIRKPKTSVDDLIGALEKKGYSPASRLTINTIRADTRDTMKVLKEAGVDLAELEI